MKRVMAVISGLALLAMAAHEWRTGRALVTAQARSYSMSSETVSRSSDPVSFYLEILGEVGAGLGALYWAFSGKGDGGEEW